MYFTFPKRDTVIVLSVSIGRTRGFLKRVNLFSWRQKEYSKHVLVSEIKILLAKMVGEAVTTGVTSVILIESYTIDSFFSS